MASFFSVGINPFSTPVGQKIEQATDSTLATENWSLNMQICDLINDSPDTARDAIKAIRKRLQQSAGKNNQVIMHTLTVLETCVKNCGKPFHVLVAHKDFIQELIKLIGPKNDPPLILQEKVLNLIQIWADAFKNQPDLNGVIQIYNELKNKGVEFPSTDAENIVPIYTPQRSVPEASVTPILNQQAVCAHPMMKTSSHLNQLSPDQLNKLQAELDIVVTVNMSILSDMLNELKAGQESVEDYQLLNDLVATCKEIQARIVDLIGRFTHDELTAELLRINDELNHLFLRHQRYEKIRSNTHTNKSASSILGTALGVPITNDTANSKATTCTTNISSAPDNVELSSLLHFTDLKDKTEELPNDFTKDAIINAPVKRTSNKDVDEFDILAQSRTNGNNKTQNLPKDILFTNNSGESDLTSSLKYTGNSADLPLLSKRANENEINEMEAWLGNSKELSNLEETITTSEFDKFLEERAAAAENLPTINALNITDKQQQQSLQTDQSKSKKNNEELLLL